MRILIIIAIATALWLLYKFLKAEKVKGRNVEISPYRQNSNLSPLGTITATLGEMKREGDEIWFICRLENEHTLGEITFDYIKIKAKSVDDDINAQKPVVCYVLVGHSNTEDPPQFIDWGIVKVI